MNTLFIKNSKLFIGLTLVLMMWSCEPLVDTIPEIRDCEPYTKADAVPAEKKDTVKVMTWNIRFGCVTEILWFGDACGERTVLYKKEVEYNLDRVIAEINRIHPDVLLLQEVDIISKRSAYIEQMKYIMDRTYFGYGYYATNWKSQFIPSDGIGRMDEGNAILSVWPMDEAKMYPLPLRGDVDALTRYFYVRESVMSVRVNMPGGKPFYAVNTHLSAFSTDDTKQRQLNRYISICDSLVHTGLPLVTGGDYNLIPPNSDVTDYCLEDACEDEHYHGEGDDPMHKEGSYYTPEITWLNPLYSKYYPSLPLESYKNNQTDNFTACADPENFWHKTLDYLFASTPFVPGSHKAWQELRRQSDHAPVTAYWIVK